MVKLSKVNRRVQKFAKSFDLTLEALGLTVEDLLKVNKVNFLEEKVAKLEQENQELTTKIESLNIYLDNAEKAKNANKKNRGESINEDYFKL